MAWDWDKLQEKKNKQTGGGQSAGPPRMDEVFEKIRGARKKFPGGSWIIIVIVVGPFFWVPAVFIPWRSMKWGVVQRFGKYVRTAQPGLSFKAATRH